MTEDRTLSNSETDKQNETDYDPLAAFNARRTIYLAMIESQRLEHAALKRMAMLVKKHKEQLLIHMSHWLLSQESEIYSDEVMRLSNCSMKYWCTLQTNTKRLSSDIVQAAAAHDIADSAYRAAAPMGYIGLGIINEWTADEERRSQIAALKAKKDGIWRQVQQIRGKIADNDSARKQFGKRFLRGCLNNIVELEKSRIFGPQVFGLCRLIRHDLQNEWQDLSASVLAGIVIVDDRTSTLYKIYRGG